MVKRLKKYVKFVVCCTLIMSLVAPSYAALSASDGSAFVTKAEFDSALVDFNSRLTTFEAGINSKIDSQVTSFLDRNGIWSAKTQDPVWTEKKWFIPLTNAPGSPITNYYFAWIYNWYDIENVTGSLTADRAMKKTDSSGLNWSTRYYTVRSGQLFNDLLLDQCNKTGMISIDFELYREPLMSDLTDDTGNNYQSSNIANYFHQDEDIRKTKPLNDALFQSANSKQKYNYVYASSGSTSDNAVGAGRSENLIINKCTKTEGDAYIAEPTSIPEWESKWMFNTLDIDSSGVLLNAETANYASLGKTLQWNAMFFVQMHDQLWLAAEWLNYGRYPTSFVTSSADNGQAFLVRINSVKIY